MNEVRRRPRRSYARSASRTISRSSTGGPVRARAAERPAARRPLVSSARGNLGAAGLPPISAYRGTRACGSRNERSSTRERRVQRVLIANRGEVAVRIVRACRSSASRRRGLLDADRTPPRAARRPCRARPAAAAQSYLDIPSLVAAGDHDRVRRGAPGLGLPRREPALRASRAQHGVDFIGPPPRRRRRWATRPRAKEAMPRRAAARAGQRGRARRSRQARARRRRRSASRCCSRPRRAAAGAACASRAPRTSSTTRVRRGPAEARAAFGDGALYVEKAGRRRPPRRDPGVRRRLRARVLTSASATARCSATTRS